MLEEFTRHSSMALSVFSVMAALRIGQRCWFRLPSQDAIRSLVETTVPAGFQPAPRSKRADGRVASL